MASSDLSPLSLVCFLTNSNVSTTRPGPGVSAVRAVTMETPSQAEPRPVSAAPVLERPPAASESSSYSLMMRRAEMIKACRRTLRLTGRSALRFSSTCYQDSDGGPTCDSCPPGYAGRRCERYLPPPATSLDLLLCFAGRGGVTGVTGVTGPAGSSGEQVAVEQPGFPQVSACLQGWELLAGAAHPGRVVFLNGGFRSRWAPVVEACCRNKKVPGDLSGCCLSGRTLEP